MSATNLAQYVSSAPEVLITLTVWLCAVCIGSCAILSTWSWNTVIAEFVLPPVAVIVKVVGLVNCNVVWYLVTVKLDIDSASIAVLILVNASS